MNTKHYELVRRCALCSQKQLLYLWPHWLPSACWVSRDWLGRDSLGRIVCCSDGLRLWEVGWICPSSPPGCSGSGKHTTFAAPTGRGQPQKSFGLWMQRRGEEMKGCGSTVRSLGEDGTWVNRVRVRGMLGAKERHCRLWSIMNSWYIPPNP